MLGTVNILLLRVKKPGSTSTGFPNKKSEKKSLLQHTLSHILHCAISVFVLFSLLLAESLSLLKYISCHGNDVIVCKTIYCPWKGIHDETERQHVLKRDPTESSRIRTQISKIVISKYSSTTTIMWPRFPQINQKSTFPCHIHQVYAKQNLWPNAGGNNRCTKIPTFLPRLGEGVGVGADGRLRIRMVVGIITP